MGQKLRTVFSILFLSPFVVVILSVTAIMFLIAAYLRSAQPTSSLPQPGTQQHITKFSTVEEFQSYLKEAQSLDSYSSAVVNFGAPARDLMLEEKSTLTPTTATGVDRVSQTNVQVEGIDEPDIVKTDGKQIYLSSENLYYPMPVLRSAPEGIDLLEEESIMPVPPQGKTEILEAFPPESLTKIGTISRNGNLLLSKNILVIISNDTVTGYDVSDPSSPNEKWTMKLENNNSIVTARLHNETLYFITQTYIDSSRPCPIVPLSMGETSFRIPCTDIYHPVEYVPIDSTFTVFTVAPTSGAIQEKVSFTGSSASSIVYMSEKSLYLTYSYATDWAIFFFGFVKEQTEFLPSSVVSKIERLTSYEIGNQAKLLELQTILETYQQTLSDDERLKFENELNDRMQKYVTRHSRELEKTGIVKVRLSDMIVEATGEVPGRPLNQFSMDEYNSYLRMATTVGQTFGAGQSANDVYVLGSTLAIVGSVQDMGLTEQIYSVRFLEDRGYVVTFRQTDPFYVLDLSDPTSPTKKGELKIPGYSSYLHPIKKHQILGVGKEDSNVKLTLFDIQDPQNPKELDTYILQEYWSEALSTHHAFTQDELYDVVFIPGSNGGYIFSYKDNLLSLEKAVSDVSVRRALYVNDYLYVVGETQIVVLNEKTWEEVKTLDLQ